MPIRATGVDRTYNTPMETALVEGLSSKYTVYSGDRVTEKVKEIFKKVSEETEAGQECDAAVCLQNVAIEFQAELIAMVTILKSNADYFLTINIKNVLEDKVVLSKSETCEGCSEIQVIAQLKAMVGVAAPVPQMPAMQMQTGKLKVDSTPSKADVLISDSQRRPAFKGKTPLTANLTPGEYKILITKSGYKPLELSANVESGGIASIGRRDAVLARIKGKLKVTSKPSGAQADIVGSNGRSAGKGTTPFTADFDAGSYRVVISMDGYSSVELEVEVPGGGTVEIGGDKARLKKQEGTLTVTSEPLLEGAEVFIDGKPSGRVPLEIAVRSGRHSVRIDSEYKKGSKSVVVEDESSVNLAVPLRDKFRIAIVRPGVTGGMMKIGPSGYWAPLSDLYFPVYGMELDLLHGMGKAVSPAHLSLNVSTGTLNAKTSDGDKFKLGITSIGLGVKYERDRPGGLFAGVTYQLLTLDYTFTNAYGTSSNESTNANVIAVEAGYLLSVYKSMNIGVSYAQSSSADITLLGKASGITYSRAGGVFTYDW
jgi:hypothetical protein